MKWLQYLPAHWQENVQEYIGRPGSKYDELSATDFVLDLRITFEDGSSAFFNYAFYLPDTEAQEIAVFTEHCGYHIYPFCISSMETLDGNGHVLRTEAFLTD